MDTSDLIIDVFTPYYCDNKKSRKTIEEYGGKLIEIGFPFEPGRSRRNICKPLAACLNKDSYDVVHIHSGSISVLALAAMTAKKNGIKKIIVHSHSTGIKKNMKYKLTKLAMTPLLDLCPTDYCACSKKAGEWKFSKRSMKKLIILKNGVDLEKYGYSSKTRKEIRTQLGLKQDDYIIGHTGRFSTQKNQEFIIELLAQVMALVPEAKVIFVGDGETMPKIQELVKQRNVDKSVRFIGNVDNVQDYLQAMDVFVFPSRFEGLGIVGIEAQVNGLEVIASTNVPQELKITPLVKYFDLNDQNQWVSEIVRARNNKRQDVREEVIRAGYDIRKTASQLLNLYQNH